MRYSLWGIIFWRKNGTFRCILNIEKYLSFWRFSCCNLLVSKCIFPCGQSSELSQRSQLCILTPNSSKKLLDEWQAVVKYYFGQGSAFSFHTHCRRKSRACFIPGFCSSPAVCGLSEGGSREVRGSLWGALLLLCPAAAWFVWAQLQPGLPSPFREGSELRQSDASLKTFRGSWETRLLLFSCLVFLCQRVKKRR